MTDRQSSGHALVELTSPSGRITLETADTHCTVRFDGEIDAAISLASFQQVTAAVEKSRLPVRVDCSTVTFFCIEGLSMLAMLMNAAADGRLAELSTAPAVDSVLGLYPPGTYTLAT